MKHERLGLYIGTFGKYAAGDLSGAWVYPSDFDKYEDFRAYCEKLHSDEQCPEIMVQDTENLPWGAIGETISADDWNTVAEYARLIEAYGAASVGAFALVSSPCEIFDFESKYCGEYDDEKAFAEELAAEYIDNSESFLARYFDYSAFARDLFITDYVFVDGYVFSRA